MSPDFKPQPGISREQRLSELGLQRLEQQLQRQAGITDQVLKQWIRRYGKAAEQLIRKHGRKLPSIDLD